jgi:hypothetical protein
MQAFRLRLLTFAGSGRLMATAQASSPLRSNQVLCPVSGLGFPPVSDLVLRPSYKLKSKESQQFSVRRSKRIPPCQAA